MKSLLSSRFKLLLLAVGLVFAVNSAKALEVPALTGRVVDNAYMFDSGGKQKITNAIKALEHDSGGQMAVLTVNSLKGDSIEDFAMRVEEKWKIGHKGKDNGLLLVISKKDKKIRVEVGYGWEQYINDARAGDIIRAMGPYFRKGDFAGGVLNAVSNVNYYVTGKGIKPQKNKSTKGSDDDFGGIFFLIFIAIFIGGRFFLGTRGRTYGTRGGFWGGFGGSGGGGGFGGGGGSSGGGGASGGW